MNARAQSPELLEPAFLSALTALRRYWQVRGQRFGATVIPTAQTGGRVEFLGHQTYEPRDPPSSIDWRVFARNRKLMTKQCAAEVGVNFHVVLDCSASMGIGNPNKFLYARRVVFGLGYVALGMGASVTVSPCMSSEHATPPSETFNRDHSWMRLAKVLTTLEPAGSVCLGLALRRLALRIPQQVHVLVLSDFIPSSAPMASAHSRQLTAAFSVLGRRRSITLLQVLAPEDLRPVVRGRVTVIDSETLALSNMEDAAACLPSYHRALSGLREGPRRWCQHHCQQWFESEASDNPCTVIQKIVSDVGSRTGAY